ncbi:MAG: BrnA antitoxin family protein [Candidatus Sungbacteria bacterium]|nr:BrnA antitoxin family protein [Candidatus Sungbacteria bacterium]
MRKQLNIPKFKNENEERKFWSRVDLSEHFLLREFKPAAFPNLKPSSRSISLRLPEYILARLKERAHALNVPYQSLMKQYIARGALRK